jgi:WD40 repeat protein
MVVTGSKGLGDPLHVWRTSDGELLRELRKPRGSLSTLAFSPDGSTLLAVGGFSSLLWSANDGQPLQDFSGFAHRAGAGVYSPDGSLVLLSGIHKPAHLFRTSDGSLVRTLGPDTEVSYVAKFSPDGKTVLILSKGQYPRANLWRVSDGALLHTLDLGPTAGESHYLDGAFSPDGNQVVIGGHWVALRVWNTGDGSLAGVLSPGESGAYTSASFSPDGFKIVTYEFSRTHGRVSLWEMPR